VAGDAAGLERTPQPTLDQTRKLAALHLSQTPARRLELTADAGALSARLELVEQIAIAADDLGVTRFCLSAAIDHARERHQFGRPIGSFQALQHQLADTALALECAWAATYEAAWCLDQRPADAARAAALAASVAGDAALAAAEQNQQLRAGIGFTWDDPAHLYLKRAKSNRLIWGHPDAHRARLAQQLRLTAP
jgi:alkylation response protein AidB-like acyl-CoA dehydrogenase